VFRGRLALITALAIALGGCGDGSSTTPPTTAPGSAPAAVWGVPDRSIRIVAYNVQWHQASVERVAEVVNKLKPDVALLSEVPPRDAGKLADAIGFSYRYVTPTNDNDWGKPATAVFSRFPLENGRVIENPGGSREPGVMVEAIADGKRFCLAAVHLTPTLSPRPQQVRWTEGHRAAEISALRKEWQRRGSPPMVVGGDFNQVPLGPNYAAMTQSWSDALGKLGRTDWTCQFGPLQTRVDYILISSEWTAIDGNVVDSNASDHRPIWVDVMPPQSKQ
jgi:endonuclease/exonuclease/phosphatase (EEP) superfamily protein YafD